MREFMKLLEGFGTYTEIEFVCINPATGGSDPAKVATLYKMLSKMPGLVLLRQEEAGHLALVAIIVEGDMVSAKDVRAAAKKAGVNIDTTREIGDHILDEIYDGTYPDMIDMLATSTGFTKRGRSWGDQHAIQESVEGGWPQEIDGNTLWRKINDADLHHRPQDFDEGDLIHNIESFGRYELRRIPVEGLNLGIYAIDDDLVGDYAGMDAASQPPIVYDPTHNLIIDGNHRANAAAKRGDRDILAYVGDPSTYSPPEDEDDDGESEEY